MKIAIITYALNAKSTKNIIREGKAKGHEMIVYRPDELAMFISDTPTGYDRLFRKKNSKMERIYANSVDAIIPRIGTNIRFTSTIVDHFNHNLGIFSMQGGEGIRIASNKLLTIQKCSQQNIHTPKTVYAKDPSMIDFYLDLVGGTPVIVKTTSGSLGEGVLLLDSYMSAKSTIQALFKQKTNILIQEYIDAKGVDYRGVVVGEKVVAAYKRQAKKNDFRANMHKGASAVAVELSQQDKDFCVKCAKILNLHTAAIDFMKDAYGMTKLIEVNSNYGFKIEETTGVNLGKELINFVESQETSTKSKSIEFPTEKDIQLRTQSENIERLMKNVNAKNEQLNYFVKNEKIGKHFKTVKGKTVSYLDTENKKQEKKVDHINDLFDIMVDMFNIKK